MWIFARALVDRVNHENRLLSRDVVVPTYTKLTSPHVGMGIKNLVNSIIDSCSCLLGWRIKTEKAEVAPLTCRVIYANYVTSLTAF